MAGTNEKFVPSARQALDQMKWETAEEVGAHLTRGYNGDITAREAGRIGGNMVRKMIRFAEQNMK